MNIHPPVGRITFWDLLAKLKIYPQLALCGCSFRTLYGLKSMRLSLISCLQTTVWKSLLPWMLCLSGKNVLGTFFCLTSSISWAGENHKCLGRILVPVRPWTRAGDDFEHTTGLWISFSLLCSWIWRWCSLLFQEIRKSAPYPITVKKMDCPKNCQWRGKG